MRLASNDMRIAVAMSGGVDSSVAAALVAASGVEAIGLTLQLYGENAAPARAGACCAGADIADARAVADTLGIAHYVIDRESRFRAAVIDDFADDYVAGRTPIPCVRCNQSVKFTDLVEIARDLGCAALVTGHHARRVDTADGPELHRALDPARDQSWFLFATTRAQLGYLRLPIGEMTKADVRRIAAEMGLRVADKPDSQDICFVPGGRYADLVRKLRPDADRPGEIVDRAGAVLGHHAGTIGFTVGQRRGVGVGGAGAPLYVLRIDAGTRRVVVGPRSALGVGGVVLGETNWLTDAPPVPGTRAQARVRSAGREIAATMGVGAVRFDAPEPGVAPGQACVLYDGTRVLGGGFIASTIPAASEVEHAFDGGDAAALQPDAVLA